MGGVITGERARELSAASAAVRCQRVEVRREIGAVQPSAAVDMVIVLILVTPPWALGWRLEQLLKALPRVGPRRIDAALRSLGGDAVVTVGDLSPAQRRNLVRWLQTTRDRMARRAAHAAP